MILCQNSQFSLLSIFSKFFIMNMSNRALYLFIYILGGHAIKLVGS